MTEEQTKKTRKVRTIAERRAELRESAEKAVGRAKERMNKTGEIHQAACEAYDAALIDLADVGAPTDPVMHEVVEGVVGRADAAGHAI